jgi:hypothetical protein
LKNRHSDTALTDRDKPKASWRFPAVASPGQVVVYFQPPSRWPLKWPIVPPGK